MGTRNSFKAFFNLQMLKLNNYDIIFVAYIPL